MRTHLVFRTDARHSGEHRLDAAARGIGSDATCGGIDGLHLARLAAYFCYLQVAEHILLLVEFGIDGEIAGGFDVAALHLLVANAREDNHERVGVGHREFVFTLIVGGSAQCSALNAHGGKLDGIVGLIGNLARNLYFCVNRHGHSYSHSQNYDVCFNSVVHS